MSFPSNLHTIYTLLDNVDDVLATHPNTLSSEIRYLEDKVGIDGSVVITSFDYFLKNISGAYRTHTHDGSSDDGSQLDWDTCWSDAVHSHASAGEGGQIVLTTGVTGTLPTANGGTSSTANANAANGVLVLDGSGKIPALDGSQITNINLKMVQIVNTIYQTPTSNSTGVPFDTSIPQNTEGAEIMTLAITPTSATNKLLIQVTVVANAYNSGGYSLWAACLFQDSTANALAVAVGNGGGGQAALETVTFSYYMTAGTTSPTTFKVRVGKDGGGTLYINQTGSGITLGNTMCSSITITEIKV